MVDLPEPDSPVNHRIAGLWPLRCTRATLSTDRLWRWTLVARRRPKVIMPAPAVAFVKRSIRMNAPVSRFSVIRIERHRRGGRQVAQADLIEAQRLRGHVLQRVDIHLVLEGRDARGHDTACRCASDTSGRAASASSAIHSTCAAN